MSADGKQIGYKNYSSANMPPQFRYKNDGQKLAKQNRNEIFTSQGVDLTNTPEMHLRRREIMSKIHQIISSFWRANLPIHFC